MWCGCKPTDKSAVSKPQPFSTMDDDPDTHVIGAPSDDAAQDAGRSVRMRVAPASKPRRDGRIPAAEKPGF